MSTTKTAIDHREYGFIMNSRYSSFSEDGELPFTPVFIDPVLHIATLSGLYEEAVNKDYYGIRIYPGLTNDNQMVLITCDAKSADGPDEENYRIFDEVFLLEEDRLPPVVTFSEAKDCHVLFLQRVKVEGDSQPPVGSSVPHMRKSRTYPWANIKEFVEENIENGDLSDPSTLGTHYIKLETGYVPSYLQAQFLTRQPVTMPDHLRGFCVIFTLLTRAGVPMIKPDQLVDEGAAKIYERNYMDLGKGCPPICGGLN